MKLPTKTTHCMECGKAFSESQTTLFASIGVTRVLCGACFDLRLRVDVSLEDSESLKAAITTTTVH